MKNDARKICINTPVGLFCIKADNLSEKDSNYLLFYYDCYMELEAGENYEDYFIISSEENSYRVECRKKKKAYSTDKIGNVFAWINGTINDYLYSNGIHVIHASACKYNDRVVLFMGEKGAGKTTAVRKMVEKGASFIADDNVCFSGSNHMITGLDRAFRVKNGDVYYGNAYSDSLVVSENLLLVKAKRIEKNWVKPTDIAICDVLIDQIETVSSIEDYLKIMVKSVKNANSGPLLFEHLLALYSNTRVTRINTHKSDAMCSFLL